MSSDWIRRLDEGLDEEPPDDSTGEPATDPSSVPDWGARGFFIQMLHEQYHVEIEGIWNKEHAFYIVVPSLDPETKALDGQPLQEWFKHHRPAACPVYLCDAPPEGSTRARDPSIQDETTSWSAQLPHEQFILDLNLRIPVGVPAVSMRRVRNALQLITERELTSREEAQVTGALSQVACFNLDLEFTVEQPNRGKRITRAGMDLVPSKLLHPSTPSSLKSFYEEDDAFWVDRRATLLGTGRLATSDVLPAPWRTDDARCLVDTQLGSTCDIRTLLPLYDKIVLAVPAANRFEQVIAELNVTADELRRLVELGRVALIATMPLHNLPADWLASVIERSPESVLGPRRLATAALLETRQRLPVLFPPLEPAHRHEVLRGLYQYAASLPDNDLGLFYKTLPRVLSKSWFASPILTHQRGPIGVSAFGIGNFVGAMKHARSGVDRTLEWILLAQAVEWASALNAHVIPSAPEDSNNQRAVEDLAGVYSWQWGTEREAEQLKAVPASMNHVASNLLTLSGDLPVLDLAQSFSSAEISRFRSLVADLAAENQDPEYLDDAINRYREELVHYESNKNRWRTIGLAALTGVGAGLAFKGDPVAVAGTAATTMIGIEFMVDLLEKRLGGKSRLYDALAVVLGGVSGLERPNRVLVSRMRRRIKR